MLWGFQLEAHASCWNLPIQKSEGVQGLARGRLSVSLPGEGGSLPFLPDNLFLPFVMSGTLGTPPHLGEKSYTTIWPSSLPIKSILKLKQKAHHLFIASVWPSRSQEACHTERSELRSSKEWLGGNNVHTTKPDSPTLYQLERTKEATFLFGSHKH